MVPHDFEKEMIEKQLSLVERVKAAFILNTSVTVWGDVNTKTLQWICIAFPKTEISHGTDQGARYYTITPKFR